MDGIMDGVLYERKRAERAEDELKRFRDALYETLAVYGPGRFVAVSEVVREIERRARER